MKTINRNITLSLFGCALALLAACPKAKAAFSSDDIGTAAAQFLKLGPGARATSMGEAMTASADDSSAIYWNPGGLANVRQSQASFTHATMFEDIRYEWASFALPAWEGAFAVGAQYMTYGAVDTFDNSGNATGSIHPHEMAVALAYGHRLFGLDAGLSVKYISSQLQHTATAVAVDAGVQYALNDIMLGLSAQNMGSSMKYVNESDPLPFLLRTGAAWRPVAGFTLAADLITPKDSSPYFGAGAEYCAKLGDSVSAALRGGYNSVSKDVDGTKGIAFGAGLTFGKYMFDFAFAPMGDLGNTNRFTLGMQF